MTNELQTSNINLSYRKGYMLPPYIQLNPFESIVNSTTIRRGNPHLTQSTYHSINIGYTIKDKYFLSMNSSFYSDYFARSQILEDETTIISYQNIGNKNTYSFQFNTNYILFPWWRTYINVDYDYKSTQSQRVNTITNNYFLSLNNSLFLPKELRFNIITSFSNGNSTSFETPNNFLRIYSTASLSKRFLKDKLSVTLKVLDIFGTNNKNKNTYLIDNTVFTNKEIYQRPKIFLNISYSFESGKKIIKKLKKKSGVDGKRF